MSAAAFTTFLVPSTATGMSSYTEPRGREQAASINYLYDNYVYMLQNSK